MAKRIVHKHTLVKCKQVRADQIEFGEIAIQAHEYGPYLQVKDRNGEVIRVGGIIFAEHQPPCAQKGAWWVKINRSVEPIEYTLYVYQGEKWVPLIGAGEVSCCDVEWDDILNKPDCFEPCPHEHPPTPWPDIPEKPDCFEPCPHEHPPTPWPDIPEKPDCFEPCPHTHPWDQVTEKPDCFPPCDHEHDFPEPNDGKLTVKTEGGDTLGEFTANQAGDTEVVIPDPPEPIPPNDGKLTIKDSEDNVLGEFTADQPEDTEVVIPCCDVHWDDIEGKPCIPECHSCEECLEALCRYVGTPSLEILLEWLGSNSGYGYNHCCYCTADKIEEPLPIFEIWMHDGKNPYCIYDFENCWRDDYKGEHQLHYRLKDGTEGIFHTEFVELIESDDMFHHVRFVPVERDLLPRDQEFEVFIVHEEEPDLIACHHPDHDDWVYWDNIIGIPPDIFDPELHLPSLPRIYDLKDTDLLLVSRKTSSYYEEYHDFAIQAIHAKEYFHDMAPTMDDGRPLVHVIVHEIENGRKGLGLGDTHAPYWAWYPDGTLIGQIEIITKEMGEVVIAVGNDMKNLFYEPTVNNGRAEFAIGPLTDTSKCTSMEGMFNYCYAFEGEGVEYLDTRNVTNMRSMFGSNSAFVGDVSGFNTSKVEFMGSLFYKCTNFNSDISGWDVSHVTDMNYMFRDCKAFDQDIRGWDTHRLTGNGMNYMFFNTMTFKDSENSDLSEWCVPEIKSRPYGWNDDTVMGEPVWGTCPRGEWVFDWHDLYEND